MEEIKYYVEASEYPEENGYYEELYQEYDDYETALISYNENKIKFPIVSLMKITTEILFKQDIPCEHNFTDINRVDYGKDENGEFLIYYHRCTKCNIEYEKSKIYIKHID